MTEPTLGEQEHEATFRQWWEAEMARQYPFYNRETRTGLMFSARQRGDRRAYDAGYRRGLAMRGCCNGEEPCDGSDD